MTLNTGRAVRLWHVHMLNPSIFPRNRSAQVIVDEFNRELHSRTPDRDRQT